MNTRQRIQHTRQPPVLALSFSASRKRFAAGLSNGLRTFRTDNCLATDELVLPSNGGASIVAVLDDRYSAYVSRRKDETASGPSVVVFWDAVLERELSKFDFHEPVLGIRLTSRWMIVILRIRTVVFQYQQVRPEASARLPSTRRSLQESIMSEVDTQDEKEPEDEPFRAPNSIYAVYSTAPNPFAVACLRNDLIVLPAPTPGQVQIIFLDPKKPGSKRVLPTHKGSLRFMALSDDSTLLATTSEKGTLIRVWNTKTHDSIAEFRRGADAAAIYGLAFSPGNRWLACTSDKGTLHMFDLRPLPAGTMAPQPAKPARPRAGSYATHRLSAHSYDKDSASQNSAGRSSPSAAIGPPGYQGSVQEYYSLRPPPAAAAPPAGQAALSAMSAFKSSPFAPKIFADVRSVASAPIHMGDDPPHWQGGNSTSWTTAPNGTRRRVRNPVPPLPGDPSGRPPEGVLALAPVEEGGGDDDSGAVVYVLGGGSDARWEVFDLLPTVSDAGLMGWVLRKRGFRKFLTRQFAD